MNGNLNMADLFGKMQEMQQKMAESQAALKEKTVTAEAGGGMVTVTADGAGAIRAIKLEPAVINPDDQDLLEDLLIAGINKALDEAAKLREREMRGAAGAFLPPGMGLDQMGF
ncbi:MAG: YbaB/EbfC family nucleoid-associated protein, partial [Bacteroidota bacterium]